MSDARTLVIRFGDTEADYREFARAWHAAERGEDVAQDLHVLSFESLGGFLSCLTEKRWALLHLLRRRGPLSIRALAKALDRNYKNVHTDIRRLMELDLVELNESGLVQVPWDEIDARIDLAA